MRVFGSFDIVFCREPAVFEGGRANSLLGSRFLVSFFLRHQELEGGGAQGKDTGGSLKGGS